MKNITSSDYNRAKRICRKFKITHLGQYNDLYLKSDKLFYVYVSENFRKTRLEIYELDPAKFPKSSQQAAFKKTEVKLELLTGIYMQLIAEKGIRGELCNSIKRYAKANNKYMRDYGKNEESSHILNIGM